MTKYNALTLKYIESQKREYRSRLGQFFTPFSLVRRTIELARKYKPNPRYITEPSSGTGQFTDVLRLEFKDAELEAFEIDAELARQTNPKWQGDFLASPDGPTEDLIIGNPPYFELPPGHEYKSDLIVGRYNMYALFVEKAIRCLRPYGVLAFVIPNSLCSGPSFRKLREFIHRTCSIREIVPCGGFSEDAEQDVMIFVAQWSVIPCLDFVVGDCFSADWRSLNAKISKVCICDLASVATGEITWNQHKDNLCDSITTDNKVKRLVYASDFGLFDSKVEQKGRRENAERKRYVRTDRAALTLPVILVARAKTLKFVLVEKYHEPIIAENHINVISGRLEDLRVIDASLRRPETLEYFKSMAQTLNFSKSQLLSVPVWL